jgi:class 3 adenylate cyclase/tetratricopeptide (TPR) repeat protein
VTCSNCGASNAPGKRFCSQCGAKLGMVCPNCGAPLTADDRFCGECGTPIQAGAAVPSVTSAAVSSPIGNGPSVTVPTAERRFVSILFADLVGFTSLSEKRDAEEVRELLTRYFDTSRQIIGRYGGVVEKFIGDAVMAVWGTPVAQEDDAERAVRAALDLMQSINDLGNEVGAPELRARAGVLTGEAAVTIGMEAQGMVAGDLVNTASRIQSVAEPGTVLVGEATRRATEDAVVYEEAGAFELKGKAEPLPLWRALRVVAGVGGHGRSIGLESPFVGRDREMRLLKELFHGSAEDNTAHLVSVVGIAGIGKSRLEWEFDKYTDGLAGVIWWHRGRCLAYGDGVTYWALAEMVRMRARIAEGEEATSAMAKLRAAIETHVQDPEERRWIEPRLAHLLGLEERTTRDREDLFSAWRLFFERMAEVHPVTMVFEDMQWADAALLDFIEYLLEWSRNHAIFILTVARPDLLERRPSWGAGRRNFTSLFLEPLPHEFMHDVLSGLVPGLPEELRAQILDRSEGIPLYAVETVRMLIDRGLLKLEGSEYRPTGPIQALDVPETLQGLIAARLDGLAPDERRLLQHASVLGKVFTKGAVAAVMGLPESQIEDLLASLVRKEVVFLQADPRSPELGQYGFLQELVKRVAYETLARKDRKATHLAMAKYLETTWGAEEDEIIEVVASHYLDAYRAAPDAPDAEDAKTKALDTLVRAGERAASLAANEEAQRYFEHAAELAENPTTRAEILERAGQMALMGGRSELAGEHFQTAMSVFEAEGRAHAAARVSARLAEVDWKRGRLAEAIERMELAFQVLSADEPDEDLASLAAQLGRFYYFKGEVTLAAEKIDFALGVAERLWLPEILSHALNTEGIVQLFRNRPETALALVKHSLEIALEHDLPAPAARAYQNLSETLARRDRHDEAIQQYQQGLNLARKVGSRWWESTILTNMTYSMWQTGRWNEALEAISGIPDSEVVELNLLGHISGVLPIMVNQGRVDDAERLLALFPGLDTTDDVQERAGGAAAKATVLRVKGDMTGALAAAQDALSLREQVGIAGEDVKTAFVEAAEAAIALDDLARAEEVLGIVEGLPPGGLPPFLRAQSLRFRARLAEKGDPEAAESGFKSAAGMFRELDMPFWMAVTLLEHGEWLTGQGRADEAALLLDEARTIFGRLDAKPWLERLGVVPAAATAGRATGP